jgi:hypothetical protein
VPWHGEEEHPYRKINGNQSSNGEFTMIPNQWYAVLEPKEVVKGKPLAVIRMGERIYVLIGEPR